MDLPVMCMKMVNIQARGRITVEEAGFPRGISGSGLNYLRTSSITVEGLEEWMPLEPRARTFPNRSVLMRGR